MARISKIDLKPVIMICGLTIASFAFLMLIPAAVDYFMNGNSWLVFIESAGVCLFFGLAMFFSFHCDFGAISIRQAFLFTVLSWLLLTVAASLPFYIYLPSKYSYTDAFFEAMSGLSTTGATIIVGLDNMTPGILFWRSLLNGMGGIGIVVVAVSLFPYFSVGGMHIFRTESSENFGKITPRVASMTKAITIVYIVLIVVCALLLKVAGMSYFDAFNHAMATVATGGFSTKDSSVGFYNNPYYEIIIIIFMLAGSLPLTYYVRIIRNDNMRLAQDKQVVVFLWVVLTFVLAVAWWLFWTEQYGFWQSLRNAAFNVVSIVTDTGFASKDYYKWGLFAVTVFFFLPFIGGCTGSTSGSIKMFRWQIVVGYLKESVNQLFLPHKIIKLRYGDQTYSSDLVISVLSFFSIYLIFFGLLSLSVSFTGVDLLTSTSTVAACMANAGPGLGEISGPAGTYNPLPETAKWLLSFAMLIGRLEIFTILVLFMPEYWKN